MSCLALDFASLRAQVDPLRSVTMFVFFEGSLTKHCQDRTPSSKRPKWVWAWHGQGMSVEVDIATPALISIFAPVRFAVLCQSAAEESLGASGALPCFLAICLRSGPSSFQLG